MQRRTSDELMRLADALERIGDLESLAVFALSDTVRQFATSWQLEIAELTGRSLGLQDVVEIQSQVIGHW